MSFNDSTLQNCEDPKQSEEISHMILLLKYQAPGEGRWKFLAYILTLFTKAIMTVYSGTITVVLRLPKFMFDILVREVNTITTSIFKNPGSLAEQPASEKSSLGSLSR